MERVIVEFRTENSDRKATLVIEENEDSFSIKSEFKPPITNNEPADLFTTLVGVFFSSFQEAKREGIKI